MDWRTQWRPLFWLLAAFLAAYHLPVGGRRFDGAVLESLQLVKSYAREHVLLCLVPAFFIAGAISNFIRQGAVLKYLGPSAPKPLAYGVASVSGSVLAVCSCTVLPLFAGIYRLGAGLGPASAFLYSGPAINVLAIILSARILGMDIGIARAAGAVLFSIVLGLAMAALFRRDNQPAASQALAPASDGGQPLRRTASLLGLLIAILVFANWGAADRAGGLWNAVHAVKWWLTGASGLGLGLVLVAWHGWRRRELTAVVLLTAIAAALWPGRPVAAFSVAVIAFSASAARNRGEIGAWFAASWGFAKQITPLLLGGVLVAGLLLGRPGEEGLVPSAWIARAVGGDGLGATLFAAAAGALMYFATLTEVPILQGLLGAGMGKGPALALLLAGPALSLPSMLVIHSIMGGRRTAAFIGLVVVMAAATGLIFGALAG